MHMGMDGILAVMIRDYIVYMIIYDFEYTCGVQLGL